MAQLDRFIPISAPSGEFDMFLQQPGNSRIIFSGKFGTGKTTFLREYFRTNKDKYVAFHLFPTNYVATSNDDIFQLIKYDLFYRLLDEKPPLEKLELSYLNAIPFVIQSLELEDMGRLAEYIPKIGKSITPVIGQLLEIHKLVKEKRKELGKDEGQEIKEFAEQILGGKGLVYESDLYTNLIVELIERVKQANGSNRESILIVDDLDRLDPDNLFRILNVFSAHLDAEQTNVNKFAFDKVIFCCDIENIRLSFHHRFGSNVDFVGYIDKFFSTRVFYFDNKREVSNAVEEILGRIQLKNKALWDDEMRRQETVSFYNLRFLVSSMINSETFSLRQLIKLNDYYFNDREYELRLGNGSRLSSYQIAISVQLDLLTEVFGSKDAIVKAIKGTNLVISSGHELERLLGDLCLVIELSRIDFSQSKHALQVDQEIEFQLFSGMSRRFAGTMYWGKANPAILLKLNLNRLFEMAIDSYLSLRTNRL